MISLSLSLLCSFSLRPNQSLQHCQQPHTFLRILETENDRSPSISSYHRAMIVLFRRFQESEITAIPLMMSKHELFVDFIAANFGLDFVNQKHFRSVLIQIQVSSPTSRDETYTKQEVFQKMCAQHYDNLEYISFYFILLVYHVSYNFLYNNVYIHFILVSQLMGTYWEINKLQMM